MLQIVNPLDQVTAARIVELLDPATPWYRALWTLSLCLTLREFLEACKAERDGILHDKAVARLGSTILKLAGTDPGASADERRQLVEALKQNTRYQGVSFHEIELLASRINSNYLARWSADLAKQQPERAARCIASHLLDLGLSGEYLRAWWTEKLYKSPELLTLAEICVMAHLELAQRADREFKVLIAFKTTPKLPGGYPDDWLPAHELTVWLEQHGFSASGVRASGGLLLSVMAKDPIGAARAAEGRLDQFVSRTAVAMGQPLTPWPVMWVFNDDERQQVSLAPSTRGVRVKVLLRENLIFKPSDSGVDAAIELLAHLESSSPAAAIAGGWAAIEALLSDSGDKSTAAENLAWLVAASFPRAELTALSYKAARGSRRFKSLLGGITENRMRAATVADCIAAGDDLDLLDPTDQAGLQRIRKILQAPANSLLDIQGHVAAAFHRLYRQRNLVLHGGHTNGVALRGSLRTAAKLVGAGMDRIAHGWYVKNRVRPLELVALAKTGISLLPANTPRACVEILGD